MPLPLGDLLRIGCTFGPKLDGITQDGKGGSCALGAIIIGWEHVTGKPLYENLIPEMQNTTECPVCFLNSQLQCIIPHLNDTAGGHNWSREAIAMWLDSIDSRKVSNQVDPIPAEMPHLELVGV